MPHKRTCKNPVLPVGTDCCAGTLLRVLSPITPATRVMDALHPFTASPEIERFARPYTRELFGGKPVVAFMNTQPLIVDVRTDLDDLSRMIFESDMHYRHEGFIKPSSIRYRSATCAAHTPNSRIPSHGGLT